MKGEHKKREGEEERKKLKKYSDSSE